MKDHENQEKGKRQYDQEGIKHLVMIKEYRVPGNIQYPLQGK